jgi:hypothetical protein
VVVNEAAKHETIILLVSSGSNQKDANIKSSGRVLLKAFSAEKKRKRLSSPLSVSVAYF